MQKIVIVDFGSQYTQLIARRIRSLHVYCEIVPWTTQVQPSPDIIGLILSGGPASVCDVGHPDFDISRFIGNTPVLGICYGMQLIAQQMGGRVDKSSTHEYGSTYMTITRHVELFREALASTDSDGCRVWMSHGDRVSIMPPGFMSIAESDNCKYAAIGNPIYNVWGLQFHPEVSHTQIGELVFKSFVVDMCKAKCDWLPNAIIESSISDISKLVGDGKVLCAVSGGIDSIVCAALVDKTIGPRAEFMLIDNGFMRNGEVDLIKATLGSRLNVVDASDQFFNAVNGIIDPEEKRKAIGATFISVFNEYLKTHDVKFLAQGTIYPDVIESSGVNGTAVTIKSHHNVGGLPPDIDIKLIEPLRALFKDEVRRVAHALRIDKSLIDRQPFPGPGLAIRVIGEVTPDRVEIVRAADVVLQESLKKYAAYAYSWQVFCVLLPVSTVGVMGDCRTYENVLAIRAVDSTDGMTASISKFHVSELAEAASNIVNKVKGINRVVYDITTKPPATIEWE